VVGQADAGTTADSSDLKATHGGASCTTSHAAVPASEPDSDPPGPPPPHSQLQKRQWLMGDGGLSLLHQVTAAAFAASLRQDEEARAAVSGPGIDRGVNGDQRWSLSLKTG
jgi:hypothetical protein